MTPTRAGRAGVRIAGHVLWGETQAVSQIEPAVLDVAGMQLVTDFAGMRTHIGRLDHPLRDLTMYAPEQAQIVDQWCAKLIGIAVLNMVSRLEVARLDQLAAIHLLKRLVKRSALTEINATVPMVVRLWHYLREDEVFDLTKAYHPTGGEKALVDLDRLDELARATMRGVAAPHAHPVGKRLPPVEYVFTHPNMADVSLMSWNGNSRKPEARVIVERATETVALNPPRSEASDMPIGRV